MIGEPQPVPFSLRVLTIFNPGVQIGMFLFGFGSIFFWFIATHADLSFLTFHGPMTKVTGTITSAKSLTPAGRSRNRISENHYEYSVAGQKLSGVGYTTGVDVKDGQQVTVEYANKDPRWSRVVGMRRDQYMGVTALVTIVPLLGLLVVYASVRAAVTQGVAVLSLADMRPRPFAAFLSLLLPAFVIFMNARALWRHLQ